MSRFRSGYAVVAAAVAALAFLPGARPALAANQVPANGGAKKESVDIKFFVPKKVGDVRDVSFVSREYDRLDVVQAGVGLSSSVTNSSHVVFKGRVKTLAVDQRGRDTRVEVTAQTFKETFNGKTAVLLKPDATVILESRKGGVDVKYQDGDAINDPVIVRFLRKALKVDPLDAPVEDLDAIFGTKEKKTTGASWPADMPLLLQELNRNSKFKLNARDVRGMAKVAIVKQGDAKFVDLQIAVAVQLADQSLLKWKGDAANLKLSAAQSIVANYRFPIDYATGPVRASSTNDASKRGDGKVVGVQLAIIDTVRDSWTEETKYVPVGGVK